MSTSTLISCQLPLKSTSFYDRQPERQAVCWLGAHYPWSFWLKIMAGAILSNDVSQRRSQEAGESSLWSRGQVMFSNSSWWLICLILHPSFIRPNQLSEFQSPATGRNSQPPKLLRARFHLQTSRCTAQILSTKKNNNLQPWEHYAYKMAPPTSTMVGGGMMWHAHDQYHIWRIPDDSRLMNSKLLNAFISKSILARLFTILTPVNKKKLILKIQMTAFLLRHPDVCPPRQSTFCFPTLRIKYQYMTPDKMFFGALLSDYFSRE